MVFGVLGNPSYDLETKDKVKGHIKSFFENASSKLLDKATSGDMM